MNQFIKESENLFNSMQVKDVIPETTTLKIKKLQNFINFFIVRRTEKFWSVNYEYTNMTIKQDLMGVMTVDGGDWTGSNY